MYYLQNRWKYNGKKLVYYGIRAGENLNRNTISLTARQTKIISSLPKELSEKEKTGLKNIIASGAVLPCEPKKTPLSLADAQFCTRCCANDYIIPWL